MAGNKPSEAQTLRAVEGLVSDQLPSGWSLRARRGAPGRVRLAEAEWSIRSPDGGVATFIVKAKRTSSAARLRKWWPGWRPSRAFLSSPLRTSAQRRELCSVSAGSAKSTPPATFGSWPTALADRPGLFIQHQGSTKDPWPSPEMLQSLRGRGAGRAVRALVDFRPPYGRGRPRRCQAIYLHTPPAAARHRHRRPRRPPSLAPRSRSGRVGDHRGHRSRAASVRHRAGRRRLDGDARRRRRRGPGDDRGSLVTLASDLRSSLA